MFRDLLNVLGGIVESIKPNNVAEQDTIAAAQQHQQCVSMLSSNLKNTRQDLNLISLPWDIRHLIYTYLFEHLAITVTVDGDLDLSSYPWEISATCQVLRNETLPYLYNTTPTSTLSLICPNGRFPPSVRARLPNHILHSIRHITILDNVYHDDLCPSLRTFPNLETLNFDLYAEGLPGFADAMKAVQNPQPQTNQIVMSRLVRRALFWLHYEQTVPREGLEKDYLPERTLWAVVDIGRQRRGFDVKGQLRYREYEKASGEEKIVMLDLETRGWI